jgi:nucleoside triphosphate diphosphatase
LLRAFEYGSRAAAVGFDWAEAADIVAKIEEETRELREVVGQVNQVERVEEEMGDLLFALANLSRKLGVEPEAALRKANDKFRRRFTEVETHVTERGERLQDKTLGELDAEWRAVKAREHP